MSPNTSSRRAELLRGLRDALPMAASAVPWGLVFGLLAQPILSLFQTFVMSAYVYSGTAQFVALEMFTAQTGLFTLLVAVFAANARYLLQGVTLWPHLKHHGAASRTGILFFLTDMSWALSLPKLRSGEAGTAYLVGASVTIYLSWVIGSTIGYLIPVPFEHPKAWGLDFAIAAALIGLVGASFQGRQSLLPWAATLASAAVLANWLSASITLIASAVIGAAIGAWRGPR